MGIHQGIWSICHYYYFFKIYLSIWLWWIFVAAHRLSVVAVSAGYSVAACGLLIVVASLVAVHRL